MSEPVDWSSPETIGAAWCADSSLERWFPFTADEVKRLRAENERLRCEVKDARTAFSKECFKNVSYRDALKKAKCALVPFECETCQGTKKFKFECPGCITGEAECTCDKQEEETCPQCQRDNGLKEMYANREEALAAINSLNL